MKSLKIILLAGLVFLPGVASAQIAAVLDLTNTRPGTYYYSVTYAQDGSISIKPIRKIEMVGSDTQPINPIPNPGPFIPPPQPQPPPVPVNPVVPLPMDSIELRVQQLTEQAIQSGGSVTTAVGLQRVYNLVASTLDTKKLSKDKTFEALRVSTDIVMQQSGEGAKWTTWRSEISKLLADIQNHQGMNTAEAQVGVLRRIESGIKSTVNAMGQVDPNMQDRINYDSITKAQLKIIDELGKMK